LDIQRGIYRGAQENHSRQSMLQDRYGNELSTTSVKACDAYVRGVDLYLASEIGTDEALNEAIAEDPNFVMAHLALGRSKQVSADGRGARASLTLAREASAVLTEREQGQLEAMGLLLEGKMDPSYEAACKHLARYPRDAMVAQTCLGVFGLIGFSGRPGREAETLALSEVLAPHYGDDWWFLSALSFSQMEAGLTSAADKTINRAIELNARNANAAHHRAHLYYEVGETDAGYDYLGNWLLDYDKKGLLHCHLSWHVALWALGRGDTDKMWAVVDADVDPRAGNGPPLNVMTDMAAILYRAELAGVEVSAERWQVVSDYAAKFFAKPRLAFADVHAALAHAMAGNAEALNVIIDGANGPAGDMVAMLASAFKALAAEDWQGAVSLLTTAMADHARIGGSRAQRDMIDHAMVSALLKLGKSDEARRLLSMRRPNVASAGAVVGV
jgi:tetratricopeptide (TPR) repeat protein